MAILHHFEDFDYFVIQGIQAITNPDIHGSSNILINPQRTLPATIDLMPPANITHKPT